MLVLSRKLGEGIVIDGKTEVKLLRIDGDKVRLGITAPRDVTVNRNEVQARINAGVPAPVRPAPDPAP